jgi:hypothetical protein
MHKQLIAMFAVTISLSVLSSQGVTPEEIGQAIGEDLRHPYLYFSADEVPELQERIRDDEVCNEIYARLLSEGQKLLATEVEKIPPREDRNPRYTGDWSFHHYIDDHRNDALLLAREDKGEIQ